MSNLSPIPDWHGPRRTLKELVYMEMSGEQWSQACAVVMSQKYRNGEPMVCLSCGALTDEGGK